MMPQLHASCVAVADQGILICGPSGTGKSDLALRLIDEGADLVADDRVDISCKNGQLLASAPENIKGLIEVRGLGLVKVRARTEAVITLVIELKNRHSIERVPEKDFAEIEGVKIPKIELDPFDISALAKIRLILAGGLYKPDFFPGNEE